MFRELYVSWKLQWKFYAQSELILVYYRIDNEQSSFTRNYVVEDTHTIRNITPIILRPFFKNNKKITFEGYMLIINGAVLYFYCIQALFYSSFFTYRANKMSESSAIAKRRFDPERLGTKPDFTVMTTNPQKHVELFIVEIKCRVIHLKWSTI